jgi:diketogulonate reductase-like aldo/keto reductase
MAPPVAGSRESTPTARADHPTADRRQRLAENLGAASVQLTGDDLREIDRAAAQIQLHGPRYPEHLQKLVGR